MVPIQQVHLRENDLNMQIGRISSVSRAFDRRVGGPSLIPMDGPILELQVARPLRGSDDHMKWPSCVAQMTT